MCESRLTLRWLLLTTVLVLLPAPGAPAEGPDADTVVFEVGRRHTIESSVFGTARDLVVRLPSTYEVSGRSYPVLYFLGSNFGERFAMVAATLAYMHGQGQIPEIALVGIELPEGNFGLIPQEGDEGTQSADRYLRFLSEEVFPFVDRTVRTNGYRILYGASNCGIAALYGLFAERLACQAWVASSPMLGWSPTLMMTLTQKALSGPARDDRFLYLVSSDDDYDHVTEHFGSYVTMLEKGAPSWLHWKADVKINEGHVPETDLPLALRALFPDYNPRATLSSPDEIRQHYESLSRRYGMVVEPPSELLFDVGYDLVTAGEVEKGRELFEYFTDRYPWLGMAHAGLGFAHKEGGDAPAARRSLEKALAIDPDNRFAQRLLKEIES